MLAIAGAVLAPLALAAIALMLRRRRRIREEEAEWAANDWNEPIDETPAEPAVAEPAAEPMVAAAAPEPQHDEARSAFGWDAAPAAAATSAAAVPEGVEAEPGSRVEAAYAGPSADNPSLSLKKRLKRAAFFDQREQMAAAGEAVPVDSDAGLPETLAEPEGEAAMDGQDRELAGR
jgi:hypothetical protein